MNPLNAVLRDTVSGLQKLFGDRLKNIWLYGSYARGDQTDESDIDVMALEGKVIISLKNISRDELNVDADELMERFVRGDDSRNTEGSGLGLNIAKTLMELQKGQLQLLVDGDLFKVTLIFPGATE